MIGSLLPPPLHLSRNKQVWKKGERRGIFCTAKMPKRACPFPQTFSSQYKMHIGQQELNNYGVCGNKYKLEIYGKYMLKLMLASSLRTFPSCLSLRWIQTFNSHTRSILVYLFVFLRRVVVYTSWNHISKAPVISHIATS